MNPSGEVLRLARVLFFDVGLHGARLRVLRLRGLARLRRADGGLARSLDVALRRVVLDRQFALDVGGRVFELADTLAHAARDLRDTLRAEDEKDHEEDN